MIYFIQIQREELDGRGPVKIGYTTSIQARMNTIQTGNPYPIRILGVIQEGDRDLEYQIHSKFKKHRMMGEWFSWSEKLERFIRKQTKGHSWDYRGPFAV